jgi:hypothetical protein
MPFFLRKAPKRDLYWVVNKDTGKKHSIDPISKEMATKQMTALNIAHARKMGATIPSVSMSKKDFVKEHKRLTKVLAAVKKELNLQKSEL